MKWGWSHSCQGWYLFRNHLVIFPGRYRLTRLGIGIVHAEKGKTVCLRQNVSWRTVSGLWLNTPWFIAFAKYRRAN